MAWVKSEYAGELAVLSTWLVAIAPWSVSVFGNGRITGVVFRFLPFRLQYLYGISVSNELKFVWAWEAMRFPAYTGLAGTLWTVALAVFAGTLVASVAYYAREDEFSDGLPLHPVHFFGALLGVVGLLTLVGTGLLNLEGGFAGTTVPVGALVAPVLAGVLLTADLT
ncbi:DUF7549 family protein [Haloarcula onubensis]|uniref:TIGR04206 family protein n=1 Tax=Haloarcula onubensis TaxID=2950539 RepID=A0ABU2FMR7_9EURY|nr:TIGR04206 family protein [Halomicroarcula sp. S3CR25-11]MDS0281704.1 TIGR04206 family protein [Halomicroarcula sp. S3CR25-11]